MGGRAWALVFLKTLTGDSNVQPAHCVENHNTEQEKTKSTPFEHNYAHTEAASWKSKIFNLLSHPRFKNSDRLPRIFLNELHFTVVTHLYFSFCLFSLRHHLRGAELKVSLNEQQKMLRMDLV